MFDTIQDYLIINRTRLMLETQQLWEDCQKFLASSSKEFKDEILTQYSNQLSRYVINDVAKNLGLCYTDISDVIEQINLREFFS